MSSKAGKWSQVPDRPERNLCGIQPSDTNNYRLIWLTVLSQKTERRMTITINNLTVSSNAPAGTVIGVLSTLNASGNAIPCTYILTKNSAGFFAISGDQLVTERSMPAAPGYYSVRIHATGTTTMFSGSATFAVDIVMALSPSPAPPPTPAAPTQITLSPPTFSVPDNSAAGTVLAAVSVTMSDGSAFAGQLSAARSIITTSGNNVVLARALTPADDGVWSGTMAVEARQNAVSVVQYLYGTVTRASSPPQERSPSSP